MTNTLLTHSMIAREAAAIMTEEMPFIMNVNRSREDDVLAKVNGYKKGGSIKIKIPPPFKVYDGAVFAAGGSVDAIVESYVTLTVATQKHVPLTLTSLEKALSIDEYKERILRPAMSTLCATVEADMIAKAMVQIPNLVGTAGTTPNSAKTYSQARAVLQRHLAPNSPRTLLFSDDANVELVDASKALFIKDVEDQYSKGYVGRYGGFKFHECVNLPTHTLGNKVASVLVDGASQTGSSLAVKGVANTNTFTKGTVFTIANV